MKHKVLLIGGYPKGHERPFDIATLSGRRLKAMVDEIGLDAGYFDLWETEKQEKVGQIEALTISIIKHHISEGVRCVALGKRIQKCLRQHGIIILNLPHPASRRLMDREKLRAGLGGLVNLR